MSNFELFMIFGIGVLVIHAFSQMWPFLFSRTDEEQARREGNLVNYWKSQYERMKPDYDNLLLYRGRNSMMLVTYMNEIRKLHKAINRRNRRIKWLQDRVGLEKAQVNTSTTKLTEKASRKKTSFSNSSQKDSDI